MFKIVEYIATIAVLVVSSIYFLNARGILHFWEFKNEKKRKQVQSYALWYSIASLLLMLLYFLD